MFVKIMISIIMIPLIVGTPLFLSAGSLVYFNGLIYLSLMFLYFIFVILYFMKYDKELLKNRLKKRETEKNQSIIKTIMTIGVIGCFIVSGLDFRKDWSKIPLYIEILGYLFVVLGYVLLFITMKQNSYASKVVEIQKEQKIIASGLYSIIRHPMYLAFIILFISTPIALGSIFAIFPALLVPILLPFRIADEEIILLNGLNGYREYMKKVKYKLLPFIW